MLSLAVHGLGKARIFEAEGTRFKDLRNFGFLMNCRLTESRVRKVRQRKNSGSSLSRGGRDIPPAAALLRGGGRKGMVSPSRAALRPLPACPWLPVGPPSTPRRPQSSAFLSKLRPSPASPGSSVSAAPRRAGQQRRATRRPKLRTSVTFRRTPRKTDSRPPASGHKSLVVGVAGAAAGWPRAAAAAGVLQGHA